MEVNEFSMWPLEDLLREGVTWQLQCAITTNEVSRENLWQYPLGIPQSCKVVSNRRNGESFPSHILCFHYLVCMNGTSVCGLGRS
jgi:hypothetical protein